MFLEPKVEGLYGDITYRDEYMKAYYCLHCLALGFFFMLLYAIEALSLIMAEQVSGL